MTAAVIYLSRTIGVLRTLELTQRAAIDTAAGLVTDAIARGGRVWVATTSHVLHTELYLRAGGLAAVHPLSETPDLATPMFELSTGVLRGDGPFMPAQGDVALVGTNAGTDAGTVQVALAAKAAGCAVIGLTSVAYERRPDVISEHPSGAKLTDVVDMVIDIGGVVGDGIVELPGLDSAVGPTSGVVLCAAAWAVLVGAAESLLARGLTPIVYRSVQLPGAEMLFYSRRARYETTGRGYVGPDEDATTGSV